MGIKLVKRDLIIIFSGLLLALLLMGGSFATDSIVSDNTTNSTINSSDSFNVNLNNSSECYNAPLAGSGPNTSDDLEEGLDCINLDGYFTTGGTQDTWYLGNGNEAHDGVDYIYSGSTPDSGDTWLHNHVSGPGWIQFWWRISSAIGDELIFTVDGEEVVAPITGDVDWTRVSYYIKDASDLDWCYVKNDVEYGGSDEAGLDQMTWTPGEAGVYQFIDGSGLQIDCLRSLPAIGDPNICIMLVDFNEYPHNLTTMPENVVYNAFFGNGNPANYPFESLRNFYLRSSYGKLNIQGDVLPWYRAQSNRASYESDMDSFYGEVFQYYIDAGYDLSKYDNPNYGNPPDGFAEGLYVIVTGPATGPWWYGSGEIGPLVFMVGGVSTPSYLWIRNRVIGTYSRDYANFPDRFGINEISTFCHETGHLLGQADQYPPHHFCGFMDLMCGSDYYGNLVHCDLNPYSKMYMNWITPIVVTSASQTITLWPSQIDQRVVLVKENYDGNMFNEYFLIEYRNNTGNDIALPGRGLLIWHIMAKLDQTPGSYGGGIAGTGIYTNCNVVNLMQPDSSLREFLPQNLDDFFLSGDHMGTGTIPNSNYYDGNVSNIYVSNIIDNGDSITATYSIYVDTTDPTAWATPPGGSYNATQIVSLNMSEEGEIIYYFSDDLTLHHYTTPLVIDQSRVLYYYARDLAARTSTTYTEFYTIDTTIPTAWATPIGGFYQEDQMVSLHMSEVGDIYYALIVPGSPWDWVKYTDPISITTSCTLRFYAEDIVNRSPTYIQYYVIDKVPPTAWATPPGGIYNAAKTVTLNMSELGTIVYWFGYTNYPGFMYEYNNPITINSSDVLSFQATDMALRKSEIYHEIYTIDTVAPTAWATPPGGLYYGTQTVSLNMSEEGSIVYLLSDSVPYSYYIYTSPLIISSSKSIQYFAVDLSGNPSPTYNDTYTIIPLIVTNNRTEETFSNIQNAINDVDTLDGDIISVNAGTYTENVQVTKRLDIRPLGVVNIVALNPDLPVFLVNNAGSGSKIFGFNLTGGTSGIQLENATNCRLLNNFLSSNSFAGIYLYQSSNNNVTFNHINNNPYGIIVEYSSHNLINQNQIAQCLNGSLMLSYSSDQNVLLGNIINGTVGINKSLWGICLVGSDSNNITNNTIIKCEEGINLYDVQNTNIFGNKVYDNHWDNIALNLSLLNTITQNTISNADSGIRLIGGSNNNTISHNNISGNVWTSISLVSSYYNQITDGNILSNNQEGTYLYDSHNNTFSGNVVQNNIWDGIAIHDSSYNTVTGHTVLSGNNCGVYIVGTSNHNTITLNNISGNIWACVGLNTASANTITQNNLTGAHVGVSLIGSSENIISMNNVTSNDWDGIDVLYGSNTNTITQNNITGSYYGERIIDSSSNTSYMNNFVSNTVQASDNAATAGVNQWDNGATGNYYNDWGSSSPRPVAGGLSADNHPSTTPF